MHRFMVAMVILGASLAPAALSHAQDNFAQPSQAQLDLYTEGTKAFQDGQYDQAIEYFQASLQIGPLNITYLNLGRTYFKAGRCLEAKEAFNKVAASPQLSEPTPVQVLGKLKEYRQDLANECPGTLVVRCEPSNMRVGVDDGPLAACTDAPLELSPGKHTLTGEVEGQKTSKDVQIVAMERTELALSVDPSAKADVVPPPNADPPGDIAPVPTVDATDSEPSRWLEWTLVGVGAVGIAGGLFYYSLASSEFDAAERFARDGQDRQAFDDAVSQSSSFKTVSIASYSLGFAALGGAALLYFFTGETQEPSAGRLNLGLSPTGVTIGGSF